MAQLTNNLKFFQLNLEDATGLIYLVLDRNRILFLTRRQRQENFFKLAGGAALFAEFIAQKVSIYKPIRLRYGFLMASITLKDIPVDLHAQLKQEAGANYRSLNQELLARIQRSFDLDERLTAGQVNRLIQEAVDSGPEEPLSRAKFDAARAKARAKFHAKSKAA